MNINDAIEQLQERKANGVNHIVLAYWEADMFNYKDDDKWAAITGIIESGMDWSMTYDQMSDLADV